AGVSGAKQKDPPRMKGYFEYLVKGLMLQQDIDRASADYKSAAADSEELQRSEASEDLKRSAGNAVESLRLELQELQHDYVNFRKENSEYIQKEQHDQVADTVVDAFWKGAAAAPGAVIGQYTDP